MNKKMSFEEANTLLEQSVKKMEDKALTLQESVEEYARACELLSFCMQELDLYKGQIEDINERIQKLSKED